jgi:hypothetical protein
MKTKVKREMILRLIATAFMPIFILVSLYACGGKNGRTVVLPDTTAPITTASPGGGAYTEVQYVTLATNEEATVFYSLDGVDPAEGAPNTVSASSPVFWVRIGPGTTVLKFFAVDGKGNQETLKTETYVVSIAVPPPPVADAGPDRPAITGYQVTLDGSGSSTSNGAYLSYRWSLISRPGGSIATLAKATSVNPTFTADRDGPYTVSLVVNDGRMDSSADTVVITTHPYRFPDTGQAALYTATFGEDADYTINPPSYADNGDGTIVDNNTALVWQKQDDGIMRSWDEANAYCGGLSLAGTGWRLPTFLELMTIVDYGRFYPAIDATFFRNTQSSFYWSATNFFYPDSVWGAYFSDGSLSTAYRTYTNLVRCVRGEEHPSVFTDNNDGTVTDTTTGLMWQKFDDGTARTWEQSLSYCEGLSLAGFTDWRLPNAKELSSIVDTTKYGPAIDTVSFPNTQSYAWYWTSTSDAYPGWGTYAWLVGFNSGGLYSTDKTYTYYVRCVR